MILVLDNFDSFTFNLVDYIHQCEARTIVLRNDVSLQDIERLNFEAIILSPGPGRPSEAGIMPKLIEKFYQTKPILGICLGHQAIGEFFKAKLDKALKPMHGKLSEVNFKQDFLFDGIKSPSSVVRYHSLVINHVIEPLEVIANSIEGEVMAIRHQSLPMRGLQFHPEAILTEQGLKMISNWVTYYKLKN